MATITSNNTVGIAGIMITTFQIFKTKIKKSTLGSRYTSNYKNCMGNFKLNLGMYVSEYPRSMLDHEG